MIVQPLLQRPDGYSNDVVVGETLRHFRGEVAARVQRGDSRQRRDPDKEAALMLHCLLQKKPLAPVEFYRRAASALSRFETGDPESRGGTEEEATERQGDVNLLESSLIQILQAAEEMLQLPMPCLEPSSVRDQFQALLEDNRDVRQQLNGLRQDNMSYNHAVREELQGLRRELQAQRPVI